MTLDILARVVLLHGQVGDSGWRVMEHILVSVQVTKVIVGWTRLQVTVVYSLYRALYFNLQYTYCGVQNDTRILIQYVM